MATPTKIFELKGSDWMKGLSIQGDYAIGGLFSTATNFNPFAKMGYFQPSLLPVVVDSTTITTQVNQFAPFSDGSDGFSFAIGNRAGTGTKCLYRIKLTDSTVVDYSDKIDQNATTGAIGHGGAIVYKNRLIYEQDGSIRSNLLTPTAVGDTNILSSSLSSGVLNPVMFEVGSDGVLYYTANGNSSIGKIVLTTGTTGNTANAFSFTDTSLTPKDICNDGIYTIFIADNNDYKVTTTNTTCRVFFWDTIKSKADIIYDIPDSYLISCRYVDGKVLILGASGIWVCNSVTAPKLVYPIVTSVLPISASAVSRSGNTMYWAARSVGAKIYAYGATIGKAIVYQPYSSHVGSIGTDLNIAIAASGTYLLSSTDEPIVRLLNSGSTRDGATIVTATNQLPQPYSLSYVKVVLSSPLSSGQEVTLSIHNGGGNVISDTQTKTFATYGAKQTLIFTVTSSANNLKQFEDININLSSTGGAEVQRVTVYGIPIEDNSQMI